MIKFEVKNRFTLETQFTAEIYANESDYTSVKMGLAVRWAIKSDANLRGANLSGANLSDADLSDANLRGADLRGANLRGANLRGANLSGANLRGANLRGANLRGANLRGANLSGANLSGANLSDADLRGANLRGASLRGANLSGANLSDADLRGANLRGANLEHNKTIIFCQCGNYTMYMHVRNSELMIKAGCRYFSIPKAKKHWAENKDAWTNKTDEYGAQQIRMVAFLENEAKELGWVNQ